MKKLISILLVTVLIASLFTGCNKDKKVNTTSKVELTSEYENSTELVGDPNATGELKIAVSSQTSESFSFKTTVEKFRELYPKILLTIENTNVTSKDFWTYLSNNTDIDLFFTHNNTNTTKAIQANLLADMSKYFEQDSSFHYDEYNQAVLQGCNVLGKQYLIPLNYTIPLFITTKSMIKQSGLNIDACTDTFSTAEEFARVVRQYKNNTSTVKPFYLESFPLQFPMYTGFEFIDYQNKKVSIDSPELKKFTNTVQTSLFNNFGSDDKVLSYLKNNKTILYEWSGDLTNIIYAKQALDKDNEMVIFPLRNMRGQIQAKTFNYVAVNNSSSNKQNAYYFIKLLLFWRIQGIINEEPNFLRCLPVCNHTLKFTLKHYMLDNDTPMSVESQNRAYEFVNDFIDLANQVDGVDNDSQIYSLFTKSMEPFYEDQKSYEECVKDAENKIQAYVFG